MRGAAACLKVQIDNNQPSIESYIDFSDDDSSDIQYEQVAVFSLLKRYLMGNAIWDYFSKGGFVNGIFTMIGTSIYEPPANSGGINIMPTKMAIACFNEYTLKEGLKSFGGEDSGSSLPLNWESIVDATPLDQLQQLINEYGGSYGAPFNYAKMRINHEPATLTLHRCTMQEIENLFRGDHDPHVDVFDAVKEMLVRNWSALDSNGLSQAVYDAASDTIIFKSDFSISATAMAA